MRCNLFIMQYLLTFKTLIGYFIELNWPRIILNWIYYWIELAKNNFELNIFLNWILGFFSDWIFFLNWILTIFFWIENWIEGGVVLKRRSDLPVLDSRPVHLQTAWKGRKHENTRIFSKQRLDNNRNKLFNQIRRNRRICSKTKLEIEQQSRALWW